MTKTQKAWLVLVGVMFFLFALLIVAYAVLFYAVSNMILTDQFPNLTNYAAVFELDVSFLSVGFLVGFEIFVALCTPALLLFIFGVMCFSRFKGKKAKYIVASIFGILIETTVAVWLILSISDLYASTVLLYIGVGAFPFLTVLFAIFAVLSNAKHNNSLAQTETEPATEIEVPEQTYAEPQPQQPQAPVQSTPINNTAVEVVSPVEQADEPQAIKIETAEERKFNPYYGSHGSEKVSDVVARIYGNQTEIVDEVKRKKLEKIRQMFELGVINRFEYQQLTIRILNEKS